MTTLIEIVDAAGRVLGRVAAGTDPDAEYEAVYRGDFAGAASWRPVVRPQPTLAVAIAARCRDVDTHRAALLDGGYRWRGHRYDTDPASRANLGSWVAAVAAGQPLPADFAWRAADRADVPLDAETLTALGGALVMWGTAVYRASHAHKDAIRACTSAAEVEAYDIAAGWPAATDEE